MTEDLRASLEKALEEAEEAQRDADEARREQSRKLEDRFGGSPPGSHSDTGGPRPPPRRQRYAKARGHQWKSPESDQKGEHHLQTYWPWARKRHGATSGLHRERPVSRDEKERLRIDSPEQVPSNSTCG